MSFDVDPAQMLESILKLMGFEGRVTKEIRPGEMILKIAPEEALLIGKRGRTLEALEWLVRVVCTSDEVIYIDCGGYRERQTRILKENVRKAVEQVKSTGKAVVLGPYLPSERKIIHQMVGRESGVKSESEGDGWEKWVRIFRESKRQLKDSGASR